jgi:hypothetical protein
MKRRATLIVGSAVQDQEKLRPLRPVRDLDEFLEFLRQLEALFGPINRSRSRTDGEHFRL